jgi:predicted NBD/HSP70 family sugar kinase
MSKRSLIVTPLEGPFAVSTLRALRQSSPQTLSQLAETTGLSRPTVLTAIKDLETRGWVQDVEPDVAQRGMGRPARNFKFKAESAVLAGVDVGVHKILVVLSDARNEILGIHRVEVEQRMSGAARVDEVVTAVREAITLLAPPSVLLAAGVGAPGIVDGRGRISVSRAIPEWDGINLGEQLSRRLNAPVFVENDALAATLGEHRYGAGRGTSEFIYLVAGHRTSSGMVVNGALHRGANGAAGMVGEMPMLRWSQAPDKLLKHKRTDGGVFESAIEVFEAAASGDDEAKLALAEYVDDLAVGLAVLALAVDPELIVIGGGISMAGRNVADELRRRLFHYTRLINPRVELSLLGDRATALGGLILATEYVDKEIFISAPTGGMSLPPPTIHQLDSRFGS